MISKGLLNLLSGQMEDLHATGNYKASLKAVESSVKNREPWGFFMRLGAEFAGAKTEVVDAYGIYGDYLGLSGSLATDYYELHFDPKQRDLKNGTCTLYLALCMKNMSRKEKSEFLVTLKSARKSDKSRSLVKKKLSQGRFFHKTMFMLNQYRAEALEAIKIAKAPIQIHEILKHELSQPTYTN